MKVTTVKVKHYRNLLPQTVTLSDGLNILRGDNAQGKTNFLESVYLCCIGKSPRTDKDRELIAWQQNNALVSTSYTCRYGEGQIEILLTAGKKKANQNKQRCGKQNRRSDGIPQLRVLFAVGNKDRQRIPVGKAQIHGHRPVSDGQELLLQSDAF